MRYFMCSDKEGKLDVLSIYASLEEALKKIKHHMKKEKCMLKIIPLPEIKVGCSIYKSDGSYYGTVTYETNTLWGISERDNKDTMPNPYSKQRIDSWIIGRGFLVLDGVEYKEAADMVNMVDKVNITVEEIIKNLEYVNSEQVIFFKDSMLKARRA